MRKLGGLTGVLARMTGMRVGVIDVGSNTVRLLVASVAGDDVRSVREERQHLGLGKEILLHGRVRRSKLDEVREVTGEYARIARKLGVRELETVVTAPGRQGDSPERLLDAIGRATGGRGPGRLRRGRGPARVHRRCLARESRRRGGCGLRCRRRLDGGRRRDGAPRTGVGALRRPRLAAPDRFSPSRRSADGR